MIGAGWIGLEVAAAARSYGNEVTVVEPQPAPLHAVLGAEMGGVFARLHRAHGVDLFTDTGVREFRGRRAGPRGRHRRRHARLPADLVVVGVGVVPRTELAAAAGLEVDNGVVIDAALRTSAPDVFAAGDVASSLPPALRPARPRRALGQRAQRRPGRGSVDARPGRQSTTGCRTSSPTSTTSGMEYSGLGGPDTRVVCRGNPDDGEFIAFWLEDGRVTRRR